MEAEMGTIWNQLHNIPPLLGIKTRTTSLLALLFQGSQMNPAAASPISRLRPCDARKEEQSNPMFGVGIADVVVSWKFRVFAATN